MDYTRRALQTDEKFVFLISFFFYFVVILNRILALCLCKRGGRGIVLNSRRSSFCVIYSLCDIFYVIYSYRQDIKNETRRALRTDEKLFFSDYFFLFRCIFFYRILALCLCKRGRRGICAEQQAF